MSFYTFQFVKLLEPPMSSSNTSSPASAGATTPGGGGKKAAAGAKGGKALSTSAKRIQKELAEITVDPPPNCRCERQVDLILF